jgi:hypothetical protein
MTPPQLFSSLKTHCCRDLGVKAVVLDAGDSWAQLLEGEGVIAKFVPIDFSDAEHVYENCLKVILALCCTACCTAAHCAA